VVQVICAAPVWTSGAPVVGMVYPAAQVARRLPETAA
jgi:hypothetical protein